MINETKTYTVGEDKATVQVTMTASGGRGSYSTSGYRVESPRPLTESDKEELRKSNAFSYGQMCGRFGTEPTVIDGVYFYTAKTECDSGD